MRIIYNGVDIYDDVSLNYAVHEMNAENQADTLVLRFNDPRGVWSAWNPQPGDKIAFEHEAAKTGAMYIHQMKPENGLYTVRAMSMPVSGKEKRSKSWAAVHFFQLGTEIAARHGMTFKVCGVTDQVYDYMAQTNETDFAFFSRLCSLEGCQMVIYDGSLIVYNEAYIEQQTPVGELQIGEAGVFNYNDATDLAYGSAEITSGAISGSFADPAPKSDRIFRPAIPVKVNNAAEAARFAKGLLRQANKNGQTGSFTEELMTGYAAASIMSLTTTKAEAWDGTIFLSRVRHDYVRNTSTLFFRRVILEGY
jgi:hypothetical protein